MNYKVSEVLKSLKPYQPGQSDKDVEKQYNRDFFVKLASNESPLKPFDSVLNSLKDHLESLNLYPDPSARDLREVASQYYKVAPDCILAGNGSNELIDLLVRLFCEPGESVLTSRGAFIAYKVCVQSNRANLIEIPLKEDFSLDLYNFTKELKNLEQSDGFPKLVFIPNPNNPTGSYSGKEELDAFIKEWGGCEDVVIVIDEAYNEFVTVDDFSQGHEYLKHENVVLLKTMSKVFGLAGLRLGFLIGPPQLLDLIHKIRNPFNVNTLAQVAGVAALSDTASIRKIKKLVIEGRNDLESFFKKNSTPYVPSQANFVFFDTGMESLKAHDLLLKEGLITRPLIPYGFKTQLRITIGDEEQMNFAKTALQKILLKKIS